MRRKIVNTCEAFIVLIVIKQRVRPAKLPLARASAIDVGRSFNAISGSNYIAYLQLTLKDPYLYLCSSLFDRDHFRSAPGTWLALAGNNQFHAWPEAVYSATV